MKVDKSNSSSSNPELLAQDRPVGKKKPGIPFTVFSGAAMATIELLSFGHICDRIKTHQQAHAQSLSIYKSSSQIYTEKGIKGFYAGVKWNVLTHSGKAGFRWGTMSIMDDFCHRFIPLNVKEKYPSIQPMMLGITVSIAESFFLVCPAESLKTKEMTGTFSVSKWIKSQGIKSLFDGWDAVLIRQAISWCSFLVAYDKVKRAACSFTGKTKLDVFEQFSVGALAGAINVLCTTPIDTIKTQMQKQDPLTKKHVFSVANEFYKQKGLKGLYSGLNIRMIRSTWYAGITLLMMEKLGIFRSHHA